MHIKWDKIITFLLRSGMQPILMKNFLFSDFLLDLRIVDKRLSAYIKKIIGA